MDAANGAATATISNGGTSVAPTDRTAGDTLVGRNITDHTAPDPTALRECHFGEQHYPRQRCEQAGEERALIGHYAIIAARRGKKEFPDGRSKHAPHLNARAAPLVSFTRATATPGCHSRPGFERRDRRWSLSTGRLRLQVSRSLHGFRQRSNSEEGAHEETMGARADALAKARVTDGLPLISSELL
jgi:hypothetical protein